MDKNYKVLFEANDEPINNTNCGKGIILENVTDYNELLIYAQLYGVDGLYDTSFIFKIYKNGYGTETETQVTYYGIGTSVSAEKGVGGTNKQYISTMREEIKINKSDNSIASAVQMASIFGYGDSVIIPAGKVTKIIGVM
jgi:hypothetical protein